MALVADAVSHFFASPRSPSDPAERPRSQTAPYKAASEVPHHQRPPESSHSRPPMNTTSTRASSSHGAAVNTPGQSITQNEEEHPSDTNPSARSQAHQRESPLPSREHTKTLRAFGPRDVPAGPDSSPTTSSDTANSTTDVSESATPQKIKVRDLAHIQALVGDNARPDTEGGRRARRTQQDAGPQYEISGMPIENIIEMVAGLLTKITTTNDVQHEHLHRQMPPPENNPSITPQTSSVLAFHGKNVPSITILSYLNRINKYCPTSYEVFISLLVYFDRMTEKVNAGPIQSLREASQHASDNSIPHSDQQYQQGGSPMEDVMHSTPSQTATPPLSGDIEKPPRPENVPGTPHSRPRRPDSPPVSTNTGLDPDLNLSHFFVVDSFNIHRLVIAGVTCASKFFSDIFYTNSRYAKVGGLPLPELNHLELQFLLLNDFRLSVPVEELEAYGTMLVEFYAREVHAQSHSSNEFASTPVHAGG